MSFHFLSLLFLYLLLSLSLATVGTTTIGVTYIPPETPPPPEHIVAAIQSLKITAVRLPSPDPTVVRAFSYTNISLFLSVPNYLVPSMATNRSAALLWLYSHVVPFYPRARITAISVGSNLIADTIAIDHLIPAVRNVHMSLLDLGIRKITVSTTFSFINIMSTAFPPSSAEFLEPASDLVIKPFLQLLRETNSSFFIDLSPYQVFELTPIMPIGWPLFQEHAYNYRDDFLTGVRYWNLFDMMIDAVIAAMAVAGHENIPVIVTETGWPSEGTTANMSNANAIYAEMYLRGLISHLQSGFGTPLRKEGVAETYVYELLDTNSTVGGSISNTGRTAKQNWGILFPNMSRKFNIEFSSDGGRKLAMELSVAFLIVVSLLVLL